MAESDPLGLVGRTIDDLRFDECVDTEGEGLVYRGHLSGREGPVAIKCLSLSRLDGADIHHRAQIAARFNEETKILRRLADGSHDIVQCIADGRLAAPMSGETVQYQVLEWLDGRSLKVDLGERMERGMPGRSLRDTLTLIDGAAFALAHCHHQGIVHRDLQPSKMMMVRVKGEMHLKVLDFGLAKNLARGDGPIGSEVTTFNPQYAAPEELEPGGEVGPWSDVWSLAMIMLEMMHGQPLPNPHAGSIRASALGVTIPAPVEELLVRATAPDPHARPADARAFWMQMKELQAPAVPKSSPDALAATALDDDAAAAIQRVRQMTADKAAAGGTSGAKGKGTMLMASAPPQPSIPIQEGPLAGTKPIAIPSPLASSIGGNVKTPMRQGTAPMPGTGQAIKPITPMPGPMPTPKPASVPPGPPMQQQQQQQQPIAIPMPGAKDNRMVIAIIAGVLILLIFAALIVLLTHR